MTQLVAAPVLTPKSRDEGYPAREPADAAPARPSWRRVTALTLAAGATFAALFAAGVSARARQQSERDEMAVAANSEAPRVLTALAERAPTAVEQVLPASAVPLLETAVYARTSGYLKRRLVDIGDTVSEGQLLAEIETPEVDAQLLQARATLAESRAALERNRASANLTKLTFDRAQRLVKTGAVPPQEYDDANAAYKVATAVVAVSEATINASEANVRRLSDLQQFQKVMAPFAGVVTARNYDAGALIVADNATARELFHVARMDTLRVFADVPQTFATAIRTGQSVPVLRREMPGREFPGTVARTTNALDPRTRTLRVEVDVPNADAALLPGMYLQVRFRFETPSTSVRVPGAAVITRADGPKVALVDGAHKVCYRPVKVGRDFGTTVEIETGLKGGETLVVRPGDDLPDGAVVTPVDTATR